MMVAHVHRLNGFLLMACITFGAGFCAEMVEVLDFSADAVDSSKESCHGLSFLYKSKIHNTKLWQPLFGYLDLSVG